jgi:hypothetical protein
MNFPQRMVKSLRCVGCLLLAFTCIQVALAGSASAAPYLTTGNASVQATVTNADGLVVWFTASGKNLSYTANNSQSFLSVKIGSDIWTNNSGASGGRLLPNATSNVKIGDTIVTTWANIDGVNIIQRVWPVQFSTGGQIVISFNVANPKGGGQQTVQAQYLLDTEPDGNDGAKILTRWGYCGNWAHFPFDDPMPWFYANFAHDLPNAPSYDPGTSGVGVIDDTPLGHVMGLIVPGDKVIIGSWPVMALQAWWNQTTTPTGTFGNDGAMVFSWSAVGVPAGKTVELGRTSYGTGLFYLCPGQLMALTFYPDPLVLSNIPPPQHYVPNPFPVETYIVNSSSTDAATGVNVTLSVGPYLTIDTPTTNINAAHTVETQTLPYSLSPSQAGASCGGVGVVDWLVNADLYKNCTGDTVTSLAISVTATDPPPPIFKNACVPTLTLPSVSLDTVAPYVSAIDTVGTSESVWTHDWLCSDLGLQSITFAYTGTDSTKFRVKYSRQVVPCDKVDSVIITVTQLDSTVGGCFDFTITDCAGNKSSVTLCFRAHPVAQHPDVTPPVFTLLSLIDTTNSQACSAKCDSLRVEDDAQYDSGLDSAGVTLVTATNMSFNQPTVAKGQSAATFEVCVDDSMKNGSITIRAQDVAKNFRDTTITYCTTPDTWPPGLNIISHGSYSWLIHATEDSAWDRGLDSLVVLQNYRNVSFSPDITINPTYFRGDSVAWDTVRVIDTSHSSGFCVYATDIAGHKTSQQCISDTTVPDTWAPNIYVTPDPLTDQSKPSVMDVRVNDTHFWGPDTAHDKIGWDTGIDSVWFTAVSGNITVPSLSISGQCTKNDITFTISVKDTNSLATTACVTINALDCAHNFHDTTWCYDVTPDNFPPQVTVTALSRTQFHVHVTDSLPTDRGVDSVWLSPKGINFKQFPIECVNGVPSWDTTLDVATKGYSAVTTFSTDDIWGVQSNQPTTLAAHTSSVEIHSWVQNAHMRLGNLFDSIPAAGKIVSVPVIFNKATSLDTISRDRKNIKQYQFTMTTTGDVNLITFSGVSQTNTLSPAATWTVTSTPNGANTYIITGTSSGLPIQVQPGNDTLLWLNFNAVSDPSTHEIIVGLTPDTTGSTIIYNNNQMETLNGTNAVATLPAPYGALSGTTIVVAGTCAPHTAVDTTPQVTSIDPAHPNPFTQQVTLSYTVGTESIVSLVIYDAVGREVSRLVTQTQKPGYYQTTFNATGLPPGTYFARLESNGTVQTRPMVLTN